MEDYPNIKLCEYYKLFPTCKVWGCSRALSNISVVLSEELDENFRGEVDWMKEKYCKEVKEEEFYRLYFHSLTKRDLLPPIICDKLSDAYTIFARGEKRQLKFVLD
jgi:hypothetical protein